jgi:hypothetical protein
MNVPNFRHQQIVGLPMRTQVTAQKTLIKRQRMKKHLLIFILWLILPLVSSAQGALEEACWGEQKEMLVRSQMPYFAVKVGSASGYFLVDFGTTNSTIDPKGFMNGVVPKPIQGNANQFDNFDFFGAWGKATFYTQDHSLVQGLGNIKQAGILGNDFLSQHIFTLDYQNQAIYRSSQNNFCSYEMLVAKGFKASSTLGYYAQDWAKLNNSCTPNIPTIPVRIGKVNAVAQIDTGFDDSQYKYSININSTFFQLLQYAGVSLTAIPEADMVLSTCKPNVTEKVKAYKLNKGHSFEIMGIDGNPISIHTDVFIFVKESSPFIKDCGGIGTWQIPAAQFGGSFLKEAKMIIFDPFKSLVWFYTK